MINEPKTPGRWLRLIPIGLIAASVGLVIAYAFVDDDLNESDLLDTEFEHATEEAPEPEFLETNSLFPEARIVSASWRRNQAGANEDPKDTEIHDTWHELEAENRARRERSLQEVVKQTGGLAIHVAPAHDTKDR